MEAVSSIVILLISLVVIDAIYSQEPKLMQQEDYTCTSCLEASRKAERALVEMEMLKDFDILSSEVCHDLPANFEAQCLEKTKKHIQLTTLSFQELFNERSLCNNTGLCTSKPILQEEIKTDKKRIQLEDERGCIACRRAVRELLWKLNHPRTKAKIIEALKEYCEEAEDNEEQCKRTVYKYLPTVLTKLEKLKPTDMCIMMGMCDEGIAFAY